jgi:Flp pilus assembly protein TadD
VDEVEGESDILVVSTDSTTAVADGQNLKDEVLVASIGANSAVKHEVSSNLIRQMDLIVTDDVEAAKGDSGDLIEARRALLALVAADDTDANYWAELGKIQLQLGDPGAAYNAFQRAHELDRANPIILGYLTQLALRSGNLALAEQTARELELVAPEDPAVRLTYGYVALRQGDFDRANDQAAALLSGSPYDPSAKVLRARILLQSGHPKEAVALLRKQVALQPSDQLSLRALLGIYEFREQWTEAASIGSQILNAQPKDTALRARLIESELRSGQVQLAKTHTIFGLQAAQPAEVSRLFAPWIGAGTQRVIAPAVSQLAWKTEGDRRLALARFLLISGQPQQVVMLLKDLATLPVSASNATANALYGAAIAQMGQFAGGMERLNAVLMLDAANADALRGRAKLWSRTGAHKPAIEDAQRLVASDRASAQSRLLLASILQRAGRKEDAHRTLWEGFHDIPAERSIYEALRVLVLQTDGAGAAQNLLEEYEDQRANEMKRNFA